MKQSIGGTEELPGWSEYAYDQSGAARIGQFQIVAIADLVMTLRISCRSAQFFFVAQVAIEGANSQALYRSTVNTTNPTC